jgi:hypothetical protein
MGWPIDFAFFGERFMKRYIELVLIAAFLLIGIGCGSQGEKGINSGKDRPKPAEKEG